MNHTQLQIAIALIKTGSIDNLDYFHQWVESMIADLDRPSSWIINLYDSRSLNEAIGILVVAMSQMPNIPNIHRIKIYFGLLYIRFKKRKLSLYQLLLECGQEADLSNYSIDSSYFYSFINRIDKGVLAEEEKYIYEEIDRLLEPMAKTVIDNLPVFFMDEISYVK